MQVGPKTQNTDYRIKFFFLCSIIWHPSKVICDFRRFHNNPLWIQDLMDIPDPLHHTMFKIMAASSLPQHQLIHTTHITNTKYHGLSLYHLFRKRAKFNQLSILSVLTPEAVKLLCCSSMTKTY